jgi:hypothetical protein
VTSMPIYFALLIDWLLREVVLTVQIFPQKIKGSFVTPIQTSPFLFSGEGVQRPGAVKGAFFAAKQSLRARTALQEFRRKEWRHSSAPKERRLFVMCQSAAISDSFSPLFTLNQDPDRFWAKTGVFRQDGLSRQSRSGSSSRKTCTRSAKSASSPSTRAAFRL